MNDAIYINAYGVVSIYKVIDDKKSLKEILEKYSDKNIEDFIELISNLKDSNKISLETDSELELKPEEYKKDYNFIFIKKFI
ncbi:hypothetical protein [Aliarcobacter butzleri]|uniref:hypothetical protein n=1 Tax=Aliarcobacter butzleri TaxID=28197 RepID=UPI0012698A58|nr:hypothetical protein [Aliarcobacter butzleri]